MRRALGSAELLLTDEGCRERAHELAGGAADVRCIYNGLYSVLLRCAGADASASDRALYKEETKKRESV